MDALSEKGRGSDAELKAQIIADALHELMPPHQSQKRRLNCDQLGPWDLLGHGHLETSDCGSAAKTLPIPRTPP
eukprot:CAMPEP_0203949986 /NCGR_PEP_ID=MMETSP0359-20131031/84249_1 /ASSEMBLY_ACC=CAM_ASM_000338 /TAXON_ID=268821 /ORGANISM="Scrippsiella Hangoei, Strain SHTV-5" /LENGTH=73 /DNA_ID=CAMNT_0050882067 /DNA_START=197 /DNA_END=416 /DNA_ORIENTATION=+